MNLKLELTEKVLKILKPDADQKLLDQALHTWWANIRKKDKGGFKLTEIGRNAFIQAEIKDYQIKFEKPITLTNQLVIWLDHFIDCPFYVTEKEIYVYSERMAVQLVLFSGNIYKYGQARADSA